MAVTMTRNAPHKIPGTTMHADEDDHDINNDNDPTTTTTDDNDDNHALPRMTS